VLPEGGPRDANVWHIFPIRCAERDRLQKHLMDKGVQTLVHYPIPPHKQECYGQWSGMSLPLTELIHEQELSLPISPVMSMAEVQGVVEAVNSFS
jgi:dTDP-4-amino-4,6-dideoxygalactose transaminase